VRRAGPLVVAAATLTSAGTTSPVAAQPAPAPATSEQAAPAAPVTRALLDRVAVRWHAPETGGVAKPQFVFERELAFGARIEALADRDATEGAPYLARHVRAGLDRHIAETLLASLPIDPAPSATEIARRAEAAREVLEQRAQGRPKLIAAARAEGLSSDELDALLRRQARASLYIDKMIAPMLAPSDSELREVWRSSASPFTGPFDKVAPLLRRWFVGQRLGQALEAYYQNARSRVRITIIRSR
jgi:hypothetical protein